MIDCFIPYINDEISLKMIDSLKQDSNVHEIILLVPESAQVQQLGVRTLVTNQPESTRTMRLIALMAQSDYILFCPKPTDFKLGQHALQRFSQIAHTTQAGIIYADYFLERDGNQELCPTIDYQIGSVRDDFNFGSLLLINRRSLQQEIARNNENYLMAGWYRIRLGISSQRSIYHLNEPLYTVRPTSAEVSQFDYVDPRNRESQMEKERACSSHLKCIGAYLNPNFRPVDLEGCTFETEASVIIPVRNRVRTIGDAIQSVLSQKTDFSFNLIIIDNHSTDGTDEVIRQYSQKDPRIISIRPSRTDLGIGGCWNEGIDHPQCGKFAIQLDSDDIYQSENTLQTIVNEFYKQRCAMLIGSYTITDFKLNTIAPGLIDHKEWTPRNGRNNALRINGLGAPRAFFTPIVRQIHFPNTSYGEDYAMGLAISHNYQIGRVYESLYLCRRWEDNTDASLDIIKQNKNNFYKDQLRSLEIINRQKSAKKYGESNRTI